MFNAQEIIELEKKWFKYKIKQKAILYIIIIILLSVFSFFILYFLPHYVLNEKNDHYINAKIVTQKIKITAPIPKKVIKKIEVTTNTVIETNTTKNIIKIPAEPIEQNKTIQNPNSFVFKLMPTMRKNEVYSPNGTLHLNLEKNTIQPKNSNKELIKETIKADEKINNYVEKKPIKNEIIINTQKIDTIKYLKDKFYSTSNIIFALMLSEEYYNKSNYKKGVKWALTANDINSQNDKSWYWFAKSKVKLNQKSKLLQTLLHKIEFGDTNDN